jgi:hypothetical protein
VAGRAFPVLAEPFLSWQSRPCSWQSHQCRLHSHASLYTSSESHISASSKLLLAVFSLLPAMLQVRGGYGAPLRVEKPSALARELLELAFMFASVYCTETPEPIVLDNFKSLCF